MYLKFKSGLIKYQLHSLFGAQTFKDTVHRKWSIQHDYNYQEWKSLITRDRLLADNVIANSCCYCSLYDRPHSFVMKILCNALAGLGTETWTICAPDLVLDVYLFKRVADGSENTLAAHLSNRAVTLHSNFITTLACNQWKSFIEGVKQRWHHSLGEASLWQRSANTSWYCVIDHLKFK